VLSCSEEISEDMKANASKISQLIPQQFWSANNKLTTIKSRKESSLHITTTTTTTTRLTSAKASRKPFKRLNLFRVSKQVSEEDLLQFSSHFFKSK